MVGPVPENKVETVLKRSSVKEDWKEIMSLWGLMFVVCIIGTIICIAGIIVNIFVTPNYKEAFYAFLILVFLDGLVFVPFYLVSVRGRENYNKTIRSYGKEQLRAQLLADDTKAFYLDEDGVSSIIILTKDYLISPEQFVVPLKEIEQITFTKVVMTESAIRARAKNAYMRAMMENEYRMDIFFKNGKKKLRWVAIPKNDREELNYELIKRCPGCHFFGLTIG